MHLHLVVLSSFWLHDIWHPLRGLGYQLWSGIGAPFAPDPKWILLFVILWRRFNCHEPRCFRMGRFQISDEQGHHWHICKTHHPHPPGEELQINGHIAQRWADSNLQNGNGGEYIRPDSNNSPSVGMGEA